MPVTAPGSPVVFSLNADADGSLWIGANNGLIWTNAFNELQSAITTAAEDAEI